MLDQTSQQPLSSGRLWMYRIAVLAKTLDFTVSNSASQTISAVPVAKSNLISPHSPPTVALICWFSFLT